MRKATGNPLVLKFVVLFMCVCSVSVSTLGYTINMKLTVWIILFYYTLLNMHFLRTVFLSSVLYFHTFFFVQLFEKKVYCKLKSRPLLPFVDAGNFPNPLHNSFFVSIGFAFQFSTGGGWLSRGQQQPFHEPI